MYCIFINMMTCFCNETANGKEKFSICHMEQKQKCKIWFLKSHRNDGTAAAKAKKVSKSRDVQRVEEELSDLLMAQVEVRVKKRVKRHGKLEEVGELAIQFGSLEELNGLIDRLRG